MYPISFGDLSTGLNLYVAMVIALLHQRATGLGGSVDTSLYTSGIWSVFPHMLPDQPISNELLLSSSDHRVLAVNMCDAEAVLGSDPLAAAIKMDCRTLCQKLDEHQISYVNENPTQSQTMDQLLPPVRSVVLPASSEVMSINGNYNNGIYA